MKFTRLFVLKAINLANEKHVEINQTATAAEVFREVILAHPNIDMILSLMLSVLLLISKFYSQDDNFIQTYSINYYLIVKVNITCLTYYLFMDYLGGMTINYSQNKVLALLNRHYHVYKSIIFLFKNSLCICSYFLSIIFCYVYGDQKERIAKSNYTTLHLLFLEFFQFYCAFRFCYFLVKILINICLMPLYVASLYLGYVEDKFNKQLNDVINTKPYTGRLSARASSEDYCSICLAVFQYDETVSTLPCSRRHTFHTKCLEKWFITTVSCPLCRSDFQNNIEMSIFSSGVRRVNDNELNQQLL
jgi:hypothetical protein